MDHDIVAAMNIACKGWSRFSHPGGLPVEAMKGNVVFDKYQEPLILRVDGSNWYEGEFFVNPTEPRGRLARLS